MDIKVESGFLNAETVKNKELCQIMSEGETRPGKFGTQYCFDIQTEAGKKLKYTPNNPALKTFIKAWGTDSKKWVSQTFYAEHVKMMIKGEIKIIINPLPEPFPTVSIEDIK
jgi:hypothetical protein